VKSVARDKTLKNIRLGLVTLLGTNALAYFFRWMSDTVNKLFKICTWSVIGQGLTHKVDLIQESSLRQTLLHLLDSLQGNEGVEVAVHAD